MNLARARWLAAIAALAITACNLPVNLIDQSFRTATPSPFAPPAPGSGGSPTEQVVEVSAMQTATPREWPPPFFGTPGPTQVTALPPPAEVISKPGTFNILLAASDRATPTFRTDTLILVNFQPEYDLVTLISIPRDLFVYIPGWQMQRINAAYYRGETSVYPGGGQGLLKDTILYNLGIEVDRVALVDFDGFIKIIDTLGGVEVPVTCAYTDWKIINPRRDPNDEDNWRLFTLEPGVVHMDGDLALWYARSRKRSSDFDRGRRQQEVLRALYSQALRLNTLVNAPELFRELRSSLITDIDLPFILELLPYSNRVGKAQVRSFYINKDVLISWRTPQGASVLLPDETKLSDLLTRALGPPTASLVSTDAMVEIWNGTSNRTWPQLASERLTYAGFETHTSENEPNPISRTSLVGFRAEQDTAEVDFLLLSLGLSSSRFVHEPDAGAQSDYWLILGEDYNPCFDPAQIQR